MNIAEERKDTQSPETGVDFRAAIGLAMLACGCVMAFWVFLNIYHLVTGPGEVGILKELGKATFELREIEMDGKKIELSRGFADVIGYAIMGLYLFVGAILSTGIVSAGAALLQPSAQRVAARLERKIEGVKGKVEELGKAVGEKLKGQ